MAQCHQILDNAIGGLITGWVEARGFTREQLIEAQTDIQRANALASAARPANESGLILPPH